MAGRRSARHGRTGEQSTTLGRMVAREIRLGFPLPGLPRDDSAWHADSIAHDPKHLRQPVRRAAGGAGEGLEGEDDQRIAGEQGERFVEGHMQGGFAAPGSGIVEAGHVVMDEGRAMQHLDRGGRGVGQERPVVAVSAGDTEAEPGAEAGTGRKHRVANRGREPRRVTVGHRGIDRAGQCAFDPSLNVHAGSPQSTVNFYGHVLLSCIIDNSVSTKRDSFCKDLASTGNDMTTDGHASQGLAEQLDFETTVAKNGYVWWYVDGMSDDGAYGITLIAFIGSVFSPYYAEARRRGDADPENYVSLNVALYGRGGKRWSMTERARGALARTCRSLRIGPSKLTVDGDSLVVRIDERTVPWPSSLRGEVRVTPLGLTGRSFDLDAAGRHRWTPLSPRCSLEVDMIKPGRRWTGLGYLDRNQGERPLEADFSYWDWSRTPIGEDTAILYDVLRQDDSRFSLGLRIDRDGAVDQIEPPSRIRLPANRWRVPRSTQSEGDASVLETLEDTPFYSRSTLRTQLFGETVTSMHESLSLDRFSQRWVQALLPFRMPRRR